MDTQRLILFVVFSFSSLLLWDAWQAKDLPPPQAVSASQSASTPNVVADNSVPQSTQPGPTAAPAETQTRQQGERAIVETDLLRAEIDASGGDLRKLLLKNYRETDKNTVPLLLFDDSRARPYLAQSGLLGAGMPNHKSVFVLNPGVYRLTAGQNTLTVPLVYTDPAKGIEVTKTYVFTRDSYVIEVKTTVRNTGTAPLPLEAYFQLLRHGEKPEGESAFLYTYTGPAIYTEEKKFQKIAFDKIREGKAEYDKSAKDGWVGMLQHHFVSAWLPAAGKDREFYARDLGNNEFSAGVILPEGTVAPGAEKTFSVPLYAGPQVQKTLEALAPGLDLTRDYGWLTPLAAPMFWALDKIHTLVGNWGWAIILLTVLIKLALFPLSASSYKAMAQMRQLAPKLQKLKDLYGDDRAKMHQGMADLYKNEKVNPLGGCLPIVLQIPVFIALYYVLIAAVEMRGAPWLGWITDLTAPDPYYILPVIMGITMFIQTKLNPTPPDPMQARIMMIMPVAFSVFFIWFPSGLVLYWVVNNVMSIGQQWVITRRHDAQNKTASA
jgi:YidC/Oxa1 family membrane protein insertase